MSSLSCRFRTARWFSVFSVVALGVFAALAVPLSQAGARQTAPPPKQRPAIRRAQVEAALIRTYLKKKYPTSPGSVVRGVEGAWALADLLAPPDRDPAFVLLRKKNGKWTEATMGTSLYGAGRELGVPKRLWKKWYL